ncbi:MAG: Mn-dependent transcriptional regulator MntR [uncultured Gemmatimonadaceae bacterium]|uniref:Transcriptional regulator MntR n=1 Tax=uncultured Gemmatimonadaceae bacterium TaxID=246130 RepID=A0A6J4LLP8_9BACT|nr:MAG: Mn-dependent transcriptional regulator MntR [uncultured Gemmatimonadaceae bacterium]
MTPAPKDPDALTAPVEDYLKAVYEIERSGSAAATTTLAVRLGVAPGSVTGMVRRLAEQGLLAYEPYRGATLTPAGRAAALRTLRRHRVLESYLATVLGYPWDRVHEEAERLEHAASDELVDRMAHALGDPLVDPHGAPIPTREGRVDETVHATLADIDVGARVRVVRVSDDDGAMLRYLAELGIRPGTPVAVVDRAPFGGPIGIEVAGVARSVGPALAAQVLVEPA